MKLLRLLIALLFLPTLSQAQFINGVGTKWSDEFREWVIYLEEDDQLEELEGELTMRWQMKDDWTEWDYDVADHAGSIKLKFNSNPAIWELRGTGELITAKMLWKDDPREWRITNNNQTLTFKSKYGNVANEWILRDQKYGEFSVYTYREEDPREWVVYDDMDEEISFNMKMMMTFIAVFYGSPKL